MSRPFLAPTSLPVLQNRCRGSLAGIKWPWRETDYSPPSSVEVENEWSYSTSPSICLHCLHKDSFTSYPILNQTSHYKDVLERRVTALCVASFTLRPSYPLLGSRDAHKRLHGPRSDLEAEEKTVTVPTELHGLVLKWRRRTAVRPIMTLQVNL
jgi:hypothetical protein